MRLYAYSSAYEVLVKETDFQRLGAEKKPKPLEELLN